MPHLNSYPFTEERFETIVQQTLRDWELFVFDSKSDDGSREIVQRYADRDPRIRLIDVPRDGIYPSVNRALKLCTGEYVYIAMADDTMVPNCLERLVEVLEQHPDCSVAHCCLEIIDENSKPVRPAEAWENWLQQKYFGDWLAIPHIRRAPHDGLLYFGLYTIYTSLTQLLFRRDVFEKLGPFRTDCGATGDFEWGMRVGLNENVVHVPETLATWRRHSEQATQVDRMLREEARGEFRRLAGEALKSLNARQPQLARALKKSDLHRFYLAGEVRARKQLAGSSFACFSTICAFAARHPLYILRWFYYKFVLQRDIAGDFVETVRRESARLGLINLLQGCAPILDRKETA